MGAGGGAGSGGRSLWVGGRRDEGGQSLPALATAGERERAGQSSAKETKRLFSAHASPSMTCLLSHGFKHGPSVPALQIRMLNSQEDLSGPCNPASECSALPQACEFAVVQFPAKQLTSFSLAHCPPPQCGTASDIRI